MGQNKKIEDFTHALRQRYIFFIVVIITFVVLILSAYTTMLEERTATVDRSFKEISTSQLPKLDDVQTLTTDILKSGLQTLEFVRIPIAPLAQLGGPANTGGGGGIAAFQNYIVFVTPKGKIGFLSRKSSGDYSINYSDTIVPMNFDGMKGSKFWNSPAFTKNWFRTFDILLLPRTEKDVDLYVSHHRFVNECIYFVVSHTTMKVLPDNIEIDSTSWEDVFVAKPCIDLEIRGGHFAGLQAGGRLARGPKNVLFVTVGDHEFDDTERKSTSMDPQTDLGKLIEINLETKQTLIFASGLRNPQGLFVSSEGLIWETEHGPRGGDEINLLRRGGNYGWPEASYGLHYMIPHNELDGTRGRHETFSKPIFAFFPSIGISNLTEINNNAFPLWKGDLLVTSLKDQAIWRLRRDGERIIYSERIAFEDRIRDIEQLPGGELALFADTGNLFILWHRPMSSSEAKSFKGSTVRLSGFAATASIFSSSPEITNLGKELFERHCGGCHAMTRTNMAGPYLTGVIGREIGSVENYSYSEALSKAKGVWTEKRLMSFLSKPQDNFAGTTMTHVDLPKQDYKQIVKYLKDPP